MRRYRVVEAYRSAYPEPFTANRGDTIAIERRESPWPGWVWGTPAQGPAGWVPEAWLEIDEETAVLTRDYVATELTVKEGDVLEGELELSGWLWACNGEGSWGWVPLEVMQNFQG